MHKTAGEGPGRFTTGCQGPSALLQHFVVISGNCIFGLFIIVEVGKSKEGVTGCGILQGFPKRDSG